MVAEGKKAKQPWLFRVLERYTWLRVLLVGLLIVGEAFFLVYMHKGETPDDVFAAFFICFAVLDALLGAGMFA